jgi:hypothetical protein
MTTLTMKGEKRLEVMQRMFRGELAVAGGNIITGVLRVDICLLLV